MRYYRKYVLSETKSSIITSKLLKAICGSDLPISGGTGQSIEDPIIIHRSGNNDYVGTEYHILRCLGIGRGIEWKLIRQTLLKHNGRSIDHSILYSAFDNIAYICHLQKT